MEAVHAHTNPNPYPNPNPNPNLNLNPSPHPHPHPHPHPNPNPNPHPNPDPHPNPSQAVHAHKIIHLDLKPENVLLSSDNVPWVTDFGLSTSSNLNSQSTSSAGGRGTIYFKAPELFAYPVVVSAAADVYAFAVLAWVVCTREQPFQNLQSAETAMAAMLTQGVRPELPDGDNWRDATTAGLAELIEP